MQWFAVYLYMDGKLTHPGLKIPRKHGGWYYAGGHSDGFADIYNALWDEKLLMNSVRDGYIIRYRRYTEFGCGAEDEWNLPCKGRVKNSLECAVAAPHKDEDCLVGNPEKKKYCSIFERVTEIKRYQDRDEGEIIKKQIRGGMLHLSKKDIEAFDNWCDKEGENTLDDFFINYMRITKVGSYMDSKSRDLVVTSSITPCIEHEDLIRSGWTRYRLTFGAMDYDPKKGSFIPKKTYSIHAEADGKKKRELENKLGIKIELG